MQELTICTEEHGFGLVHLRCYLKKDVDEELRRTKRALWLARAERAIAEYWRCDQFASDAVKLEKVERKCREKAEEFK